MKRVLLSRCGVRPGLWRAWLLMVMLGVAGGFGQAAAAQTSTDTTPRTISVVDVAGRTVNVRVPVQRVALGEGRMLYLTAMLDREDPVARLVAWNNDLITSDPDTYHAYAKAFPALTTLPTMGRMAEGTFSVEQLMLRQPDLLVLGVDTRDSLEDGPHLRTLEALGIPVVFVDFRHHPMRNTEPSMRLLGELFGQQERAEAFITFRREQMARVAEVLARAKPPRPSVFIERIGGYTDDCCLTFGPDNFGQFVNLAGGRNIAEGLVPGTFGQLNPEQVMAADPEHIVITSANWEAFSPGGRWIGVGPGADMTAARAKLLAYQNRPAYRSGQAVKNHRLHAIWHQFYNSPYQFAAVQQLARWFHPTLFADLDPEAGLRQLHERFLPVPYAPGYFVSLAEAMVTSAVGAEGHVADGRAEGVPAVSLLAADAPVFRSLVADDVGKILPAPHVPALRLPTADTAVVGSRETVSGGAGFHPANAPVLGTTTAHALAGDTSPAQRAATADPATKPHAASASGVRS